jgi:hypothetical protein
MPTTSRVQPVTTHTTKMSARKTSADWSDPADSDEAEADLECCEGDEQRSARRIARPDYHGTCTHRCGRGKADGGTRPSSRM